MLHALDMTITCMSYACRMQRVKQKELPHFTGYLRKGLRTVSANLAGEELRGFGLKVIDPHLTSCDQVT